MIADLKPHAAYKDSGQDWLDSIPAHWSLLRAKRLFGEVDERSKTGKEELLSVSHLTGVTPRRLKTVTMFMAESNVGHKVCRPGDLVINTLWAWMAALGVTRHTGLVSPAYGVYRPIYGGGMLPAYADHLLRTPTYAAEYQRRSTGVNSSRLRLYPEQFLRVAVLVPPLDEQALIVRFLDWANGRLEGTIRAKRKVIALLNEQRRAVIRRAVTRGLNPAVQFQPTGIPWLGDVPAHWQISRVKNECRCLDILRAPLNSVERGRMTRRAYDYYGASGVIDKVDDYLFDDELLLIAEDGANLILRNLPLAIIAKGKFWVNNHAHILKPRRGNITYLSYLLESLNFRPWISGAAQPKLTQNRLMSILIAVAPPAEQDAIVLHADRRSQPITATISRLEREIELLREYRSRLVADVVTGKLDVREAAARLPDEALPEIAEESIDETDTVELTDEEAEA